MKPYYEDTASGIVIYHGDCREVLPTLVESVDLVLTDPPYGIDGSSGTINKARGNGNYFAEFIDNTENVRLVIVPVIEGLIAVVRCVVVTPGNNNMMLYPQPDSFGAFYQPASVGLQVFGNADAQPILYYGKNARGRNMGVPCSYRLTESAERNGHPCPKPIKAWRVLLSNISLQHQIVLDPFMGSGTTLRAAKDLGRKAIGIELEERYCEIAAQRLSQETLGLDVPA